MLFLHDALHVLHHHDGIVHHQADGEHQAQQRQYVQREAEYQHKAEGTYQRDGHRHQRDDRGAPALQEEEYHHDNQKEGLEQRLVHLVDGFGDIGRYVKGNLILHPLGKGAADFLHRLLHALGHLHGVGTRQEVDTHDGSISPVDAALRVVGLRFERYTGDVAHADHRAVRIGAEHDFLELRGTGQTSLCRDGDGEVQSADGLLTQHAGGRLTVLVLQRILHVLHGESVVGQTGGIHPNLHGIVTAADVGHTAHAGDAAQEVEHIQRSEVTEVNFIKLGIVGGQTDGHQLAGGLLLDFDAILHYLGGQARLGQLHTVLDFHCGEVGVGRDVEGDGSRETSGVGAVGLHIEHPRRAVQLLFDGGSHGLRHGQGAGTGIAGADLDHRGRDLWILVDGEHRQADETHDNNQDRDDRRKYRAVYEETDFHSFVAVEDWDSTSSFFAATRMRMPGVSLW